MSIWDAGVCPPLGLFKPKRRHCGGQSALGIGFIVFLDLNGDIARAGAGENILRAHPAVADGVSLAIANNADYFSYASTGLGRGNVGGAPAVSQIIVCDKRGLVETSKDFSAGRLFVATPLGRATVLRDYNMVNNAINLMGQACP